MKKKTIVEKFASYCTETIITCSTCYIPIIKYSQYSGETDVKLSGQQFPNSKKQHLQQLQSIALSM